LAKSFLNATSRQRAIELIFLQDSVKQNNDLTKSLSESSEKLNQKSSSNGLSNTAWPPLPASGPSSSSQTIHTASLLHSRSSSTPTPQILQRVSLTTKQLLIEYGPLKENEEPRAKSIEVQRKLRQLFND
jgi:hypothetical protein